MCAAVDEEIELKLYNVFHIRTNAVANGDEAHRIELLANLLYLYDESWNLEKEGLKVMVGSYQEKTQSEPVKTLVFKKVKKWLTLAELGHLVTGDSSIVESKKFRRLMTGMMDRLEHKLGMEGLKARVREVASRQARLNGKENFKSPARIENKRLSAALQQSPLVTVSNKLNSSTMSAVDDTSSPDNAKIPTGKQLPRTPPNQLTSNHDTSSILGNSDSSRSPSTSRMSSFYSPNVSKIKNKVMRKDRVKVLASASDFDDISYSLPITDKNSVEDNDSNSSSAVPHDISNTDLPPPGRQLPRTPAVPITTAPAGISPEIPTSSNSEVTLTPSRQSRVAPSQLSPPVPAVAKLLTNHIQPSKPEDTKDKKEVLDSDIQENTQIRHKEERSDSPDLPPHPTPANISRDDTDDLPLPPPPHIDDIHLHAPDRAATPPVSDLVSTHRIPTGRQLLSTPHLHSNKQEVQVEPSGKYELSVELEKVAIPSRQDLEDREKIKVEEEEKRQRKAKEEVERKLQQKKEADKRLEIAEFERIRIEENLKQQKEREKLEEEKILIEQMKQQLLEKAKKLEEKEKQLKEYEVRKQEEERKFEAYRRMKEDEERQTNKLRRLQQERDRLVKEEENRRKDEDENRREEEKKREKEERLKEEEKLVEEDKRLKEKRVEEKYREEEDRRKKEEEKSRLEEEKRKQEELSEVEEVGRQELVDVQKKTSVGLVLKSSTTPTRKRNLIKDKEPGINLSEVGQENEALKEIKNRQDDKKKSGPIKPPIETKKIGQVTLEYREEKSKRKPIRIGRRTGKMADNTGTEKLKLERATNVPDEQNIQIKVNQLEDEGSAKKVVIDEVDDDESALYIVGPVRKSRSKSLQENSNPVESKSRVVKRKSVTSVSKPSDVSPPKKGKNASSKNPPAERVLRGRKQMSDIHPPEEVDDSAKKSNLSKENKVSKVPRKSTKKQIVSVNPPCLNDESSLQDKLEKRRKHIDETIQNPETAISASKIVKSISSTKDSTSLQKKLERQRKIVDDASENPTPVKVLVQQSKEVLEGESNDAHNNGIEEKTPVKKVNTVVRKKNKITLPVVEDDNSLMAKLNKRRKKIEEKVPQEDLTFSNKLPKKASVIKKIDETRAKGGKKKDDEKQNECETVTVANSSKETNPSKISKKVGKNNLDVSNSRKSSDDQDYFTAAEESLHLPRPRRNCKKKFENLEGLASANSSASNTPTLGPSLDSKTFKFLDSKPVDDSKNIVDETDKKKPDRKPRSLKGRTTDEVEASKISITRGELKLVTGSHENRPPQKTIKKHARTSKKVQAENAEAIQNLQSMESVETNQRKSSKTTSRKSKAQVQCMLSEMDDEVYKTPSCKIPDELYQTPQPMGSFSQVQDEEYKTSQETGVRKSRRRQKK